MFFLYSFMCRIYFSNAQDCCIGGKEPVSSYQSLRDL